MSCATAVTADDAAPRSGTPAAGCESSGHTRGETPTSRGPKTVRPRASLSVQNAIAGWEAFTLPVTGRKPKPEGQARTRHKSSVEWVDVVDVPFSGQVPDLPKRRRIVLPFGQTKDIPLHALTRAWWTTVSRMPHCSLWTESDWRYAISTALVADAFHYGHGPSATELARREKVLGTTVDARRDLRIRYVDPDAVVPDGDVVVMDDYRAL